MNHPQIRTIKFERTGIRHKLENQFWLRVLALWLDSLLINYTIFWIIIICLNILNIELPKIISNGVYLLIFIVYSGILESSRYQSTLGKYFLGLKVGDEDRNRISFLKALCRAFLKVLSALTIIGAWMIDMNKKHQGLHDLMTKTIVKRR
ncbi:RDD family protein [Rhodocytophaga aerolata]|uniref:RDD family protein n=1 Tax=Rhodocytophaga aerolata TaxID=455078 RepID=A0ABT8RGR9_9BACT|nr:RDD family protein [Rhodocytophaga aerolata]MDO1451292.1 RDD family protein [Rhodocytophaga aerolata]